MKKLLLGLGSIAAVTAPIVAVVSCGDDAPEKKEKVVTHVKHASETYLILSSDVIPVPYTKVQLKAAVDAYVKTLTKAKYDEIFNLLKAKGKQPTWSSSLTVELKDDVLTIVWPTATGDETLALTVYESQDHLEVDTEQKNVNDSILSSAVSLSAGSTKVTVIGFTERSGFTYAYKTTAATKLIAGTVTIKVTREIKVAGTHPTTTIVGSPTTAKEIDVRQLSAAELVEKEQARVNKLTTLTLSSPTPLVQQTDVALPTSILGMIENKDFIYLYTTNPPAAGSANTDGGTVLIKVSIKDTDGKTIVAKLAPTVISVSKPIPRTDTHLKATKTTADMTTAVSTYTTTSSQTTFDALFALVDVAAPTYKAATTVVFDATTKVLTVTIDSVVTKYNILDYVNPDVKLVEDEQVRINGLTLTSATALVAGNVKVTLGGLVEATGFTYAYVTTAVNPALTGTITTGATVGTVVITVTKGTVAATTVAATITVTKA